MAPNGKGGRGKGGRKIGNRMSDIEMIKVLQERIAAETPPPGTNPLADKMSTDAPIARRFDQLAVSQRTLQGLQKGNYESMKDIQVACIPHLLAGRDLLGAAKTGSGKTLAFLVPALEKLYCLGWNSLDGLGALVISPTRELAVQIFEVLKKVGAFHEMSAGLIIGGKDVTQEQERVTRMNMLVCTPGRLLQHMDETYGFECSGLQMLVLDEADRILDMGFSATINNIVANLPKQRQTVLFSATLSKSVKDLARLSLRSPEYIAIHESSTYQTPTRLQQHFMLVECSDKLDVLWSFIKTHLKSKTIVFLSSCNQVKFVHEAFCRMRPGIVLSALHGKVKQEKRLQIFMDFCTRKEAVLFATDVAGRGLDFPEVDWVLQLDCPEDVPAYIHRVGRTARNESKGKSLVLLTESELHMTELIQQARVPIKKIQMNKAKNQPLQQKLAQQIAQDPALKHMAQKAFVSYMRSLHLQSNKKVFDIKNYSAQSIADAWGLATLPRLRFVDVPDQKTKNIPYALREGDAGNGPSPSSAAWREAEGGGAAASEKKGKKEDTAKERNKTRNKRAEEVESGGGSESESEQEEAAARAREEESGGQRRAIATAQPQSKMTKLFNRKNHDVLSDVYRKMVQDGEGESTDDEIFKVAAKPHHMPDEHNTGGGSAREGRNETTSEAVEVDEDEVGDGGRCGVVFEKPRVSKRSMKKIRINGGNGTRMVFDEETGEALNPLVQMMRGGLGSKYVEGEEDTTTPQMHAAAMQKRLAASDVEDKAEFRRRQKESKLALKIKLKKMMKQKDSDDDDSAPVRLDEEADEEDAGSERRGQADDKSSEEVEEEDSRAVRAKNRKKLERLGKGEEKTKRKREEELAKEGAVASEGKESKAYDLAAQEDLALAMIMKRRKK